MAAGCTAPVTYAAAVAEVMEAMGGGSAAAVAQFKLKKVQHVLGGTAATLMVIWRGWCGVMAGDIPQ
jgi:hypothetical protein